MELESQNWKRDLYIGDNLAVMRGMNCDTVDLIYLDPPFNSKRMYEGNLTEGMGKQSFSDIWGDSDITQSDRIILDNHHPQCAALIDVLGESHGKAAKSYLSFMGIRLMEMHRLLKETGSIYLHCDPHMSHSLKLLMDIIFAVKGGGNFRNEIVWFYPSMSRAVNHFPRKHDLLFFYTKSKSYSFNSDEVREAYDAQTIKRYEKDVVFPGGYQAKMNPKGRLPYSVWQIPPIRNVSKEKTGWATQKPLALLERIIKASSDRGDVVLDPFCGCATACIAAESLRRQWIGIDQHPAAGAIMEKRFAKITNAGMTDAEWGGVNVVDALKNSADLPRRTDVQRFRKTAAEKRTLYEMQKRKCASGELCLTGAETKQIEFMHIDRKIPRRHGGDYVWGNVHLLCSTCNGSKGARPWKAFIDGLKRKKADLYYEQLDSPDSE